MSHRSLYRAPLAVLVGALVAQTAACEAPATEVLISVGTDAPPTRRFDLRVYSATPDDAGVLIARPADAGTTLGSFAVLPPPGRAPETPVTIVLEASLAAGGPAEPAQRWRRTLRFAFVRHTTLSLPVFLPVYCGNHSDGCASVPAAECTVGVRCEERGLTCGDRGACVSADVTPVVADGGTDAAVIADVTPDDCATTSLRGTPTVLADFEDGVVPVAGPRAVGFTAGSAPALTIIAGGAAGSASAARVTYDSHRTIALEGATARQYLASGATLDPGAGNAIEFDLRVPAGSAVLSDTPRASTLTAATAHFRPDDTAVGAIPSSAMESRASFAVRTAGAGRWLHVVLGAGAFMESLEYYHFLAAAAGSDELPLVPSARQWRLDLAPTLPSGLQVDLDEVRVTSLPPVARLCPSSVVRDVPAAGGDVAIPVDIANPSAHARTYRMYLSSEISVARAEQARVYAAAMDEIAVALAVNATSADGGRGAVDLFEADGAGQPMGPSITVAGGAGVVVPAGGVFHGVLVHHVVPAMLGAPVMQMYGAATFTVRRDTLTTSLVVWDPDEPSRTSPEVVSTGSNADQPRVTSVAPGFPPSTPLPLGWTSLDIRVDQGVGTFVSVLRLTP